MCDAPIQAYRSGSINPTTGKRPMQFTLHGAFSGVRQMVPCGKCAACRLEHSRRWAVRLMHENKMHQSSEFVTLTYRNEELPHVGTLVPEHLQGFHKRLHNRLLYARGMGIRYYGCGEYGDVNKRPHYHSILFGYAFKDKTLYSKNARGECVYSSKELDEIWSLGDCKIGAVTFESCAYVARYCLKKVDGAKREAGHYAVYDADGLISEREPEFSHMSRRPGIGSSYFAKYGAEIAAHDSIIVGAREVPSIRYYDLKIEASDPVRFKEIKDQRLARMSVGRSVDRKAERDNVRMPSRKATKGKLRDIALKQRERKL